MSTNSTRPRFMRMVALLVAALIALTVIGQVAAQPDGQSSPDNRPNKGQKGPEGAEIYVAQLTPLNAHVTERAATGRAIFVVRDDTLTIHVQAKGLYPGIMHLQHAHGFLDGSDAVCPTQRADDNHDMIVDLLETRPFTGITLIPFNEHPVDLQITELTYPVAEGQRGVIHYKETVSLTALQDAVSAEYGIPLDLDQLTVFLHGVSPSTTLPDSVQSLPGVPAHITLPVACGEVRQLH